MARKLTKTPMSRLLAKDVASMVRGMPIMHGAPSRAFAPKIPKISTTKGKVSKADVLRIREQVIAEWERNQLNF